MPRRRTLPQDCIVCTNDPCTCRKKPERPKTPRQRKPEPEPTPEPVVEAVPARPSAAAAMKAAAQEAQLAEKKMLAEGPPSHSNLNEDDALMVQAVRTLSEHFEVEPVSEGAEEYTRYLDRPASVGERAAAWRARRRT